MSKSEAGKGDANTRISDWKAFYNAPIWEILEEKKSKDDKDQNDSEETE